jgi:uncharacterized protein YcfL
MKSKLILAAIALVGLAMTGCMEVHEKAINTHEAIVTGHPGGAYLPKNTTRYAFEQTNPFVLMSKGAEHSVTCTEIQKGNLEDGRLQVIANIRNRENRRIQVQINCVFKDEQGFSTDDETPWQNVILTENAQESIRFIAMNTKAKNFTIRVREAR